MIMACRRCHQKKIKCSGGDAVRNFPCRYCRSARAECVYPTRNRNVTVSESYLKALENAVTQLTVPAPSNGHTTSPPSRPPALGRAPTSSKRRFVEETTGDAFVVRLRNLATNDIHTTWTEGGDQNSTSPELRGQDSVPSYEYFSLQSDQPGMSQWLVGIC